jgi:hypothetical protein
MIDIDDSPFALPAAPAPERRGSQLTEAAQPYCIAKSAQHLEKVQSAAGSPIWFSLFSAWISDQFPWISFRPPLNLLRPAWNSLFRFELNTTAWRYIG